MILLDGFWGPGYSKVSECILKTWLEPSVLVCGWLKPDLPSWNLDNYQVVRVAGNAADHTARHKGSSTQRSWTFTSNSSCSFESPITQTFSGKPCACWSSDNWPDTMVGFFFFLQNLLNHVIVHVFSLASCIHYFPPQGPFPGISRKWKKPLWLSWNAWKPPHLLLAGKEQISWLLCLSLIHTLQLLARPIPLEPPQANCALAPWPKGRWSHLLGPRSEAGGNVVVGDIAKLCDYIKVDPVYFHLLSYGLKRGHHG